MGLDFLRTRSTWNRRTVNTTDPSSENADRYSGCGLATTTRSAAQVLSRSSIASGVAPPKEYPTCPAASSWATPRRMTTSSFVCSAVRRRFGTKLWASKNFAVAASATGASGAARPNPEARAHAMATDNIRYLARSACNGHSPQQVDGFQHLFDPGEALRFGRHHRQTVDRFEQSHERQGGLHRNGIRDRKSTRLNSSHLGISYAVFCLK